MALVESIVRAQCRGESVLDSTGALLQDSRRAQQLASPYEYLYRTMPRSTRPPPHLHTTTLCYCDDVLSVPCTSHQPTASRTRTPRHPWIARQQRVHATRWSGVEALGLKVCTESLLSWAGGPSGVRTEIGGRFCRCDRGPRRSCYTPVWAVSVWARSPMRYTAWRHQTDSGLGWAFKLFFLLLSSAQFGAHTHTTIQTPALLN